MRKGMAGGEYPEFVTGREVGDELPVFAYHRARPHVFRSHLEHIRRNGYATLDCSDLLSILDEGRAFSGKEILLTFDDGLYDLYTVVFPLLKMHRMKAIACIAPFWIGTEGLITWEQAREMHAAGLVDFQSHGFTHRRIPVSPEIVGFHHPKMRLDRRWQLPLGDGVSPTDGNPLWGLPIFRSRSRLSDAFQYLGAAEPTRSCLQQVERTGKDRFFRNPGWRETLGRLIDDHQASRSRENRYETADQHDRSVVEEVRQSKESIEKQLPGKKVFGFSYPFNERGETVERILREQDFRLVFGGIGMKRGWSGPMAFFRRTSGDFVMRLPGRGRKMLARIVLEKAARRLVAGPGY